MKKIIIIMITVLAMMFSFTACGAEADYESPQAMYQAYNAGDDIVGKTVNVYASKDYFMGQIFTGPAPDLGPTIYVSATGDGATDVKAHDDLICKVKSVDSASRFQFAVTVEIVD